LTKEVKNMKWLQHKVRKPITGVFIGVFGLLEAFVPKLAVMVASPPVINILHFILGDKAKELIVTFAEWKKEEVVA